MTKKKEKEAEKIKIVCKLKDVYPNNFENSVIDIISYLQDLLAEYSQYEDLQIVENGDWDTTSFQLTGKRLETDQEFEERMINEARFELARENEREKNKQRELKELERLAKKYKKTVS